MEKIKTIHDYAMTPYNKVVYGNYNKDRAKSFNEKLVDNIFCLDQGKHPNGTNKNLRILEIGCGAGDILKILQNKFVAEGIDREVDLNKDTLPFFSNTFNVVFTKSTIEHVQNTDHMLSEIKRVLKPGGWVIILCPSWEYNYRDYYNDYTHIKPFHRKGLQDALKINGFSLVNVRYFYYLPWLWGKDFTKIKWWLLPIIWWLRMFSTWKWANKEENIHRPNIRFAKEVQLLGVGSK